jgi:competence protein ComEA
MHVSAHWFLAAWLALAGLAPLGAQAPAQPTAPQAPPAEALVDLNNASSAELERLPGVGPRMAERIIEYRDRTGGFKKIEELMNVQGIGEKIFLNLKPLITITPPRTTPRGSSHLNR